MFSNKLDKYNEAINCTETGHFFFYLIKMLWSLPFSHQEDGKKFYWSFWEKIRAAGCWRPHKSNKEIDLVHLQADRCVQRKGIKRSLHTSKLERTREDRHSVCRRRCNYSTKLSSHVTPHCVWNKSPGTCMFYPA